MQNIKATSATVRSNIHVVPTVFHSYPTEDVHTLVESIELVFLAKCVALLDEQLRWVRLYLEDTAAPYFDTLTYPPNCEEFKRYWLWKYTLWGSDVKYRRRFYAVKQETERTDPYIAEFQHRLRSPISETKRSSTPFSKA